MTQKQLDTVTERAERWRQAVADEETTREQLADALARARQSKDQHTVKELHEASQLSRPTIYKILADKGLHTKRATEVE